MRAIAAVTVRIILIPQFPKVIRKPELVLAVAAHFIRQKSMTVRVSNLANLAEPRGRPAARKVMRLCIVPVRNVRMPVMRFVRRGATAR